ncbi:Cleavage induced protein [Phytophthora megakarya]|uniref:Cleavage induced protein n=1 Tax=Phytophthora megakarya TaxID=4795 RepID=A0A225UGQ1_9STRA|nr:Cleavage induced protein [Phytophthora megakarya]
MTSTPKHNSGDQGTFLSRSEGIEDKEGQRSDSGLEIMTSGLTARVPHPIFAIVNPPKVSSMARAALVDWLKLRKEYEEYTKDRCKDSKEDVSAVMKRVKSSFDANVLETLCEEFPDVKELFRGELHMNTTNTDIDARIIEYFHLCNSLIKKHGFTSFFLEERGAKEKCKLIVNSLPKGLKNKVQNELDYRIPSAKSDVRKLYELIRVKAKEQEIEERALKKANLSRHKKEKMNIKLNPKQNK